MVSEITCSHSIQYYDVILWYHQDGRKTLKLLGFLNVNAQNVMDEAKGKFSLDGDGRSRSSLSISNLTLNDSGVYFCAASRHSAAPSCQHGSKTHSCCWRQQPPPPNQAELCAEFKSSGNIPKSPAIPVIF